MEPVKSDMDANHPSIHQGRNTEAEDSLKSDNVLWMVTEYQQLYILMALLTFFMCATKTTKFHSEKKRKFEADCKEVSSFNFKDVPAKWPIILFGTQSGALGLHIDSILGGTFQYSGQHKKLDMLVENKGPDIRHISGVEILDNH